MKKKLISLALTLILCLGLAVPAFAAESHAGDNMAVPAGNDPAESLEITTRRVVLTAGNVLREEDCILRELGDGGDIRWHTLTLYIVGDEGTTITAAKSIGCWDSRQSWRQDGDCFASPEEGIRQHMGTAPYRLTIPAQEDGQAPVLYISCGAGFMRESDFAALTPETLQGPPLSPL